MSTIVVVDIGNTSTSVALARHGKITNLRFKPSWSLTNPRAVWELLAPAIRGKRLDGSVLCSVVPRLNGVWTSQLRKTAGTPPLLLRR